MIRKYFCRDRNGRDLFFMSIHDWGTESPYYLDTSLRVDLDEVPGIKELVAGICKRNQPERDRIQLIERLFARLRSIPGIQTKYLPEYLLDKQGAFNEVYMRILSEVIAKQQFLDYSAFSDQIRAFYFGRVKEAFPALLAEGKLKPVTQPAFVKLLSDHLDLQEQYVNHMSANMEFYYYAEFNDHKEDESLEGFLMVSEGELAFFFVRQIQ